MKLPDLISILNAVIKKRRAGDLAGALTLFRSLRPDDFPAFNIVCGGAGKLSPAGFIEFIDTAWGSDAAETTLVRVKDYMRLKKHLAGRTEVYKPPCRQDPEFRAWERMKRRCYDKNFDSYPNYGGRGIKVHEPWHNDYEAFLAHVGRRPSADHSLDRIDNNKGYFPGNVRWATSLEQKRNRRSVHQITFRGETMTLTGWSQRTGISRSTLKQRLEQYPPEVVLAGKPYERLAFKKRAGAR